MVPGVQAALQKHGVTSDRLEPDRFERLCVESLEGAPADLARRLAGRLKEWTGRTWLIAANGQGGGETMIEADRRKRAQERAEVEADPFVQAVMEAFPGAKIGDIRVIAAPVELPSIPDEPAEED